MFEIYDNTVSSDAEMIATTCNLVKNRLNLLMLTCSFSYILQGKVCIGKKCLLQDVSNTSCYFHAIGKRFGKCANV
jgi:hypothetical protein